MFPSLVAGATLYRSAWMQAARRFKSDTSGIGYIVFGASGGIGSALAARLVQQPGASVLLCGRDESKLANVAEKIGGGIPFVADPCDIRAAEEAVVKATREFGKVHGIANCVGSLILKGIHTTSEAEAKKQDKDGWHPEREAGLFVAEFMQGRPTFIQFRETWEINALSAFNTTKAGVKAMMHSGGGSIVLFSSAVAKHGVPHHEAISSAKAAVQGLALSTAATYAPNGIRVNCIAPGMTDTPLTHKITSSEGALKASIAMHPLKRIGTADDPAALAELLLSPSSGNITGQFICVDGGLGSIKSQ